MSLVPTVEQAMATLIEARRQERQKHLYWRELQRAAEKAEREYETAMRVKRSENSLLLAVNESVANEAPVTT
jgi:hypothetical protein